MLQGASTSYAHWQIHAAQRPYLCNMYMYLCNRRERIGLTFSSIRWFSDRQTGTVYIIIVVWLWFALCTRCNCVYIVSVDCFAPLNLAIRTEASSASWRSSCCRLRPLNAYWTTQYRVLSYWSTHTQPFCLAFRHRHAKRLCCWLVVLCLVLFRSIFLILFILLLFMSILHCVF